MAHFAKLEIGNKVTQIVVVHDNELQDANGEESEQKGIDFLRGLYGEPNATWIQTSYNANFRGRFAAIGSSYKEGRDVFISPKPYPSWVLNEETTEWESPIPRPSDTFHKWNEATQAWEGRTG